MKPTSRLSRIALVGLLLPGAARAGDVELSLSLGCGYPVKPNLYLLEDQAGGASDFVQTRFSGPWLLGGAQGRYQWLKQGAWKFWVGAGYEAGLGSPDYYKTGQSTTGATASSTETLNGTASYRSWQGGLGATYGTATLGEYGVFLWRRSNRLGLDGTLSTFQIQGTALNSQTAPFTLRSTASDYQLEFSMGFLQVQPTYRTFERIALGTAFGPAFGHVDGADWQLDPAYADRLRPTLALRFCLGVRL